MAIYNLNIDKKIQENYNKLFYNCLKYLNAFYM